MKRLSDVVVSRLQADMRLPDLTGTRYKLLEFVASGGMGSVWLAKDTLLNRQVALKVVDLSVPGNDFDVRLLREACILAGLEHPGIVPVHDAGTLADGRGFYCMKYVEGKTLAQHIADLNLPDKLRLLERVAEPVDFAHSRGFIHRDLKPDNIMIGAFGEVLVMDWGLAKVAVSNLEAKDIENATMARPTQNSFRVTSQGRVLGTQGYTSPEQARGYIDVDQRTDIFSLGAILRFMLTGSAAGDYRALQSVPRPLGAICEKAMAVDPDRRYQCAREMTADITRYLNREPVSAYREGLLERLSRLFNRHRTPVVLVAAYLIMRVLFIFFGHR